MRMTNNSYYGGYRTRTFQEIWESAADFGTFLVDSDIPLKLKTETINTLYYLLYARYGNSHAASSDENQFKYQVASCIFMYGPTWEKRLEVQDSLRKLTLDELKVGSKDIYNTALNPGTQVGTGTSTITELPGINSQNTTNRRKSTMEAYANLLDLLETDVTKDFLDKFSNFFIKILEPDYPLLYQFEGV